MNQIIHLRPGDKDFHLFGNFKPDLSGIEYVDKNVNSSALALYNSSDHINSDFLVSCYVLIVHDKVVARAALYNNPLLTYDGRKALCVGNYEAEANNSYSNELLAYIEGQARAKGAEYLIGPMNGSTWDAYRFSTHHSHPSFLMEPWHPLYYNEQFIQAGYGVIGKYFSSIGGVNFGDVHLIAREKEFLAHGVTFRSVNLSEFDSELDALYDLNEIAFKTNFLYTPITREAFKHKYKDVQKIIDPQLVIIAEDNNKNLIGYLFAIRDFWNTKEQSLIVKTAARHPDKNWHGLGHVLGNILCARAHELGYKSLIHAFMYEKGTSVGITGDFAGKVYKNYALYGKQL